jgi:hypothetical protein
VSSIVTVTPVAVAVAAAEIVTVAASVTAEMVAPAGIDPPLMEAPTSSLVKFAVADVTVVDEAVVAPSLTERDPIG